MHSATDEQIRRSDIEGLKCKLQAARHELDCYRSWPDVLPQHEEACAQHMAHLALDIVYRTAVLELVLGTDDRRSSMTRKYMTWHSRRIDQIRYGLTDPRVRASTSRGRQVCIAGLGQEAEIGTFPAKYLVGDALANPDWIFVLTAPNEFGRLYEVMEKPTDSTLRIKFSNGQLAQSTDYIGMHGDEVEIVITHTVEHDAGTYVAPNVDLDAIPTPPTPVSSGSSGSISTGSSRSSLDWTEVILRLK